MIHKQKIRIPSKEKIIELYVASCVKCGCDDIKLEEYEDQYGFISTASCKKCENSVRENTTESGIIKEWNNQNDIPTLIKSKTLQIENLKKEIARLKKKK